MPEPPIKEPTDKIRPVKIEEIHDEEPVAEVRAPSARSAWRRIEPVWKLWLLVVAVLSALTGGIVKGRELLTTVAALGREQRRQRGVQAALVHHTQLDERDKQWQLPLEKRMADKLGVPAADPPPRESITDEIRALDATDEIRALDATDTE